VLAPLQDDEPQHSTSLLPGSVTHRSRHAGLPVVFALFAVYVKIACVEVRTQQSLDLAGVLVGQQRGGGDAGPPRARMTSPLSR
jgi:hypothetical protein